MYVFNLKSKKGFNSVSKVAKYRLTSLHHNRPSILPKFLKVRESDTPPLRTVMDNISS